MKSLNPVSCSIATSLINNRLPFYIHLTCKEGKHNKYYFVRCNGMKAVVHWGRIGSKAQTKEVSPQEAIAKCRSKLNPTNVSKEPYEYSRYTSPDLDDFVHLTLYNMANEGSLLWDREQKLFVHQLNGVFTFTLARPPVKSVFNTRVEAYREYMDHVAHFLKEDWLK